ncbi:hypothetical protein RQP46_006024 [Phenoliferia psychrophenolica]
MRFSPLLGLAALAQLSLPTAATASSRLSTHTLPLYHRIVSLSSEAAFPPWVKRGVIHVDAHADEAWLGEGTGENEFEALGPGDRYQIAVRGRGDEGEGDEGLSIVVADSCVLFHAPSRLFNETLALYFTPAPAHEFVHLRYLTNAVEGCATPAANDGGWLERGGPSIMDVRIDRGMEPEPIRWKEVTPIVVGEDGKVVPPPREKGFVEKYWMYILPVVLIMLLTGGEEEGAPAANASRTKEVLRTLRETLVLLDKKERHLEVKIAHETESAKTNVVANKKVALQALGRRKVLEKELAGLDGQKVLLQTQLNAIESAELNRLTIEAVQQGSRTLKSLQGNMDITKVEGIMDAARDMPQDAQDVTAALSSALGDSMDMAELEAELDAMEQDELNARLDAPVPDHRIPHRREPTTTADKDEAEAEELRALQAQFA